MLPGTDPFTTDDDFGGFENVFGYRARTTKQGRSFSFYFRLSITTCKYFPEFSVASRHERWERRQTTVSVAYTGMLHSLQLLDKPAVMKTRASLTGTMTVF